MYNFHHLILRSTKKILTQIQNDDCSLLRNTVISVFCYSSKSGSSGGATPVRKVSAHEFEKGGLTKPLVTTIDGTPTFLSPPTSASELTV